MESTTSFLFEYLKDR